VVSLPQFYPTEIMYTSLLSSIRTTRPAHLIVQYAVHVWNL